MAQIPSHLKLTPVQQAKLNEIRAAARIRHDRARRAAAARGRMNFPLLPFECSWAYEEEFRRLYNRYEFNTPSRRSIRRLNLLTGEWS